MMRAIRRGIVRTAAAVLLLAAVVALPVALIAFVGWPLPDHLPTLAEVSGWLTSPMGDDVVLDLLAVAAWLLWAAFLPAVAAEAVAARHGLPTPATTRRTGNPLRLAAAALITAITVGTLTAAGATASAVPVVATSTIGSTVMDGQQMGVQLVAWSSGPAPAATRQGPATFVVGQARYAYAVERGDTLSGVARDWLGDASRWPQICTLNWHRHWPEVGGRLTDCDLIYPGWTLRLPEDATPPAGATPAPQTDETPTGSSHPDGTGSSQSDGTGGSQRDGTDSAPGDGARGSQTGGTQAGATPPSQGSPGIQTAEPSPNATSATGEAGQTSAPTPSATSSVPSSPASGSPSSAGPGSTATSGASPTGPASTAAAPTGQPTPGGSTAPATDAEDEPSTEAQDGVTLPGGFVPWSLASSIAAAVALVWLQRRRRHRPGQADDDPTDLPPPVSHLHRAVARRPGRVTKPDLAERAADVPDQVTFPPGGVGLVGDGAHAAARAALAAVLSSGGPRDPDRRGEAVIDGTTLTTLIGVDAAALGPWPRLHVADSIEHALALVEEMLMHRARIMDDHTVTDLDTLRANAPDEEPLPPVLLVTESPSAGTRMRMKTDLALGKDIQVTAILLGTWAHGLTVHVDGDGHTRAPSPDEPLPDDIPARVGVLDTDTAVAVLATLREAHTGRRPAITLATAQAPTAPAAPPTSQNDADGARIEAMDLRRGHAPDRPPRDDATDPGQVPPKPQRPSKPAPARSPKVVDADPTTETTPATDTETDTQVDVAPTYSRSAAEATPAAKARKARLRVLGIPDIVNVTEPGKPLRTKAIELAVFLTCHPEGADARGLGEHLQPGVRLRNADVRMHTNVYNLRQVFGRAAGPIKGGYVIKTAGRYQLDPTSVDVDLWTFRSLVAQAALAPPDRRLDLLRQACALYTAPLAEGCDYEWIEPHREKVRQEASATHIQLAEELMVSAPEETVELLDRAIRLDTYNEELYRLAMRARHALGDHDGIRHLMRTLTIALTDLDTEPEDSTVALAQRLQALRGKKRSDPCG